MPAGRASTLVVAAAVVAALSACGSSADPAAYVGEVRNAAAGLDDAGLLDLAREHCGGGISPARAAYVADRLGAAVVEQIRAAADRHMC